MEKRILVSSRVRTPPREGFSWVDRRFLREYGERLDRDEVLLYLFLSAVADKHGLSYYGAESIEAKIGLGPMALCRARARLAELDLISHEHPLYQVLSLPVRPTSCPNPMPIGGLFALLTSEGAP